MSVWSLMRVFSIRFRMMEAIVVVPGGAGNTLAAKAQVEYGALETQLAQRETLVQKEAGSAGQAQEAAACIVRAGLASRVGDLRDASEGLGSSIAELLGTVQQTATSAQTAQITLTTDASGGTDPVPDTLPPTVPVIAPVLSPVSWTGVTDGAWLNSVRRINSAAPSRNP